jgi:hypothetical protein
MWRVDKIINGKSLKRVKITNRDVALMGGGVVVAVSVYLAIMSGVAGQHIKLIILTNKNVDTYEYECEENLPEMEDALFGLEAFFLLLGLRLCNATKDAPSVVNESKPIALASSILIALTGLIMPVCYLLNLDPVTIEILAAFGFGVAAIATTALLFGPKVLALSRGEDGIDKKPHSALEQATEETDLNSAESALIHAGVKALRHLDLDERFGLCQRQIDLWRRKLIEVEERRSSGTNTGTAYTTVTESMALRDKPTSQADSSICKYTSSVLPDDEEKGTGTASGTGTGTFAAAGV